MFGRETILNRNKKETKSKSKTEKAKVNGMRNKLKYQDEINRKRLVS